MEYRRADTRWFVRSRWGIALHWTALSCPVSGPTLPFAEAVNRLNVDALTDAVASAGAKYLLFTAAHARQQLPAPSAVLDGILPGRTARRDLLGELAGACQRRGLKFILYYNHGCNGDDDVEWKSRVGYTDFRPAALPTNLSGVQFPWAEFCAAAKRGNPDRLVTFNPGMGDDQREFLYSEHQDYLAGEVNDMIDPPRSRWAANGLQAHRWVCLDHPDWVITNRKLPWPCLVTPWRKWRTIPGGPPARKCP